MNQLVDRFGREHTYLRISVTDRCNLRCVYCMPAEGIPLKKKNEILSLEEIIRVANVFVDMGIRKIRITGGEPLVRKNVEFLISELGKNPLVETLAMTTNAVLLADRIEELKAGGLTHLNISLDSLRADRFQKITLRDDHARVMKAIELAESGGFKSVKINVVVIAGTNDDEVVDFVHFVKDKRLNVRFIEYMPFKDNDWKPDGVFSFADMRGAIEREFELVPIESSPGDVAKDFSLRGHTGTVSFITSMTDSFCSSCNRLRLTADGGIKSCLFFAPEISLRDALRAGATDADVRAMITEAVIGKPEAHPPMEELASMDNRSMVEIGG
jgi:molybdenum cofactor biosynthesis protein A